MTPLDSTQDGSVGSVEAGTPVAVQFEVDEETAGGENIPRWTFRTTYTDEEPVTSAIVRGLAVAEGVEPTGLEPLYDSINPDTIDHFSVYLGKLPMKDQRRWRSPSRAPE